jgi:hypothetical protein
MHYNFRVFKMKEDLRVQFEKKREWFSVYSNIVYGMQTGMGPMPSEGDSLFVLAELHFPDLFWPMEKILFEALSPWCDADYEENDLDLDDPNDSDSDGDLEWIASTSLGEDHAIRRFSSFKKTLEFLASHKFWVLDPTYLTWRGGGPYTLKGYEKMPLFVGEKGTIWALTCFKIKPIFPILEDKPDDSTTLNAIIQDNYIGNLQHCRDWHPPHQICSQDKREIKDCENEARLLTHMNLQAHIFWYYDTDHPYMFMEDDKERELKWGNRWHINRIHELHQANIRKYEFSYKDI